MMKYQVLICALLVTCVSAGLFSTNKHKGGLKSKAKALIFGTKSDDDGDDEYQEEELTFSEEEESRKKATIDGETMTKMADVNNNDIPVLSLDDQAAIVDKGVDFSKPFDVTKVKNVLAEVVKEKLPPDAPPMTMEELFSVKETMEEPADPESSKAFAEEKKQASSKKKPGKSSGGSSFFERAKAFVEGTAHKVGEKAEHLVEKLKENGGSDDKTAYAGESDNDKPADGNKSDNDRPANGGESGNDKPGNGGESDNDTPGNGGESDNDTPGNGGESDNDKPAAGAKSRRRPRIKME